MQRVLVDIGSSTVKVYSLKGQKLVPLETKSIHFKGDFDSAQGITEANKEALIDYINDVKSRCPGQVKIYATAIFRKFERSAQQHFIDEFFRRTGLFFNIVPHDLESHYLEMALAGKYSQPKPVLLINIGGGSTELVITKSGKVVERHNLDMGVMTVLKDFPYINNEFSEHSLREVVDSLIDKMPPTQQKISEAIYNGGELTYMKLADYSLEKNIHLIDEDHPSMISLSNFAARNEEVFSKVSLKNLEELMPADPLWMHGARACSAIAQAICEHFGVKAVIPSDSNMVHGICRQEFRSVVLSGSFRKHLDAILKTKKMLANSGVKVLSPRFTDPKNPGEEFVVFDGEDDMSPLELERYHLNMIEQADALIICDPGGYVGASALIELGYAQALGKRVIFTEQPEEFMLKTLPMEIGL